MSDDLHINVHRELERHNEKISFLEKELCYIKKMLYAIIAVSLGSPHIGALGEILTHLQ